MATLVIDGSGAGGMTPRRRLSDDDKARIVSESMMPGASVLDVARRHRICTSLVYRWRRVLLRDRVAVEAERSLRGIAVGRKNWLFAGSDQGGHRAASIYSLVETAKLNGVDPEAWLTDIIARIADPSARRVAELLPWNYRTA